MKSKNFDCVPAEKGDVLGAIFGEELGAILEKALGALVGKFISKNPSHAPSAQFRSQVLPSLHFNVEFAQAPDPAQLTIQFDMHSISIDSCIGNID